LNSFYVLFGIAAYYLCVKVVYETKDPGISIDLLFYEVSIIVNIEQR
jgi:hypothetical protein